MENKDVQKLLQKYKSGHCTPEEKAWLESWYLQFDPDALRNLGSAAYEEDLRLIAQGLPLYQAPTIKLWPRIAVAASILVILGVGTILLVRKPREQQVVQNKIEQIVPGNNKAILTLSTGRQITLTNAKNGELAAQGGTQITKTANGKVVYYGKKQDAAENAELVYNTISTPKGGQYEVVLPDNSHVWLNAASSIKFPVAFTGNSRQVSITGEAYFEVTHNAAKPFKVQANGQTVEVLGTHFNVNAYMDDHFINTTLLQGSVKVSNGQQHLLLKPGQESKINEQQAELLSDVNTEEAVAWKNGLFEFSNTDISIIMRQLSRWYDVDIQYETDVRDQHYSVTISKYANVKDVLKFLEATGAIHFKIEGRRITVMQ